MQHLRNSVVTAPPEQSQPERARAPLDGALVRMSLESVNLAAGRSQRVPRSAELVERLPADLTAHAVGRVVVEGMAAVGDLRRPILALRSPDETRGGALARRRRALRQVWRPEADACPVADAGTALVDDEVVERAALRVDDDLSELRVVHHVERRAARRLGRTCRRRRTSSVATPAASAGSGAAAGDRHGDTDRGAHQPLLSVLHVRISFRGMVRDLTIRNAPSSSTVATSNAIESTIALR